MSKRISNKDKVYIRESDEGYKGLITSRLVKKAGSVILGRVLD